MILKVNGVKIKSPQPNDMKVNRYNLTKSGRVSSGKMQMQLVAKKRKLSITYPIMSVADYRAILDQIDSTNMFFTVEYPDEKTGNQETMTCYVGDIEGAYSRNGYYTGVNFDFIEQ